MRFKNFTTTQVLFISFLLFAGSDCFGQIWTNSKENNSFHLHNLFFHDLKAFIKGIDSNFYALTAHKPDSYWEKINENKSELLISKINKDGEISLITKLKEYASRPMLKAYNDKYYILDNDYKVFKKQFYYNCYVYNSIWELESQIKILELPHQMGFSDFLVNKEGHLFLLTKPYFIDHKQNDFKGSYLVKYSSSGQFLKKVLFDKSYSSYLRKENDSILIQLQHQKLVYPFYQTDSIILINYDSELNNSLIEAKQYIPEDKKIDKNILLSDGDRILYIDSTYSLSSNSWTSTFKIALLDKYNIRRWTIEPSDRWIFFTPKPLQNGSFITQIDKRWDSTCLVVFDKNGQQKSIKSFLMNADTRIERYRFIDFFEVVTNEIWIFYIKVLPTREEEIYFEKLLL